MELYAFKFGELIIPLNAIFSIRTYTDANAILIRSAGGVEEKVYLTADECSAFNKNPAQFIVKLEL